jgi:RNA polymerase sigma-70 factor (ECF subfamily)
VQEKRTSFGASFRERLAESKEKRRLSGRRTENSLQFPSRKNKEELQRGIAKLYRTKTDYERVYDFVGSGGGHAEMTSSVWKMAETIMAPGKTGEAEEALQRREERAWLDRCALGDERAIRWVLNRYRDRVVRLAAHVLHNSREAEDVAQEAFVKAFRQIGQFRGDSGFYAWLYRIVINLCLDRMRRKSMTSEMPLEENIAHFVAVAPDVENRLSVAQVLDSLTPPMRAALVLREVEGLEYAEIADVLNIPVGTVRSRLNTAREQFRRRWTALEEEVNHV